MFECLVRNDNIIDQAACCSNEYTQILLSNQNDDLVFRKWTITGKTVNDFITSRISSKILLEFYKSKINMIPDSKY